MAPQKTTKMHPQLNLQNREEWRSWLSQNYNSTSGVWLVIPRKNSSSKGITLDEAVEEALCFGWIDSKQNPIDAESYRLMFTPRKPKSIWSKSNKQRVEKLIQQGLMTAAGLEKVEAAKKNCSWYALDAVEALEVPTDLAAALAADPEAQRNFASFSISAKKQALWWIQSAKRQETRIKRIIQTVKFAKEGRQKFFTE